MRAHALIRGSFTFTRNLMTRLPELSQQILMAHAALINLVVAACQSADKHAELEHVLKAARKNGWDDLVRVIRLIVAGQREASLLTGLDDEDQVVVESILRGLQDPSSLPDPDQQADPSMAAPGLAHMIFAASRGDAQALQAVAMMAEQMTQTEGDMRLLGGQVKRIVDGERDPDVLCKGMGASGTQLMLSLLEELNKLSPQ